MSRHRSGCGYGEVLEHALADARAGDAQALEFLRVCAPDVADRLALAPSSACQEWHGAVFRAFLVILCQFTRKPPPWRALSGDLDA